MPRLTKAQQAERDYAIETLRELLPNDTEVLTVLRHVSASGMSRRISVHTVATGTNGKPYVRTLTHLVATALGWRKHLDFVDSVVVEGGGMDMGFHLVDCLGRTIVRTLHHHWL